MSDGMSFDKREVREFVKDLSEAPRRVREGAIAATTKATQDSARDARALAPVDTGNLRQSIAHEMRPLAGGGIEGDVYATASYAPYVEYGTSTGGAQPFLRPSFDRNAPLLEQALEQLLGGIGPTTAMGGPNRPLA